MKVLRRTASVLMFVILLMGACGCQWPFEKKFPFARNGVPVQTLKDKERAREEGRGWWADRWKSGKPRYGPAPKQPKYNGYSGLKGMFRK